MAVVCNSVFNSCRVPEPERWFVNALCAVFTHRIKRGNQQNIRLTKKNVTKEVNSGSRCRSALRFFFFFFSSESETSVGIKLLESNCQYSVSSPDITQNDPPPLCGHYLCRWFHFYLLKFHWVIVIRHNCPQLVLKIIWVKGDTAAAT